MSGRAFAGGMLIGVIIGSTGWWQYSGQDSPQQVRVASERNRPLALGLTVPPPATEQNQATVDDAPPTPTVAAAEQIQAAVDETSPTPTVAAADSYWSVGKLRPLTRVVDVAAPGMARYVVQRRSYKKEIIMFTSDHQMIGWAGHWVNQMRKRGYEHWLILGDKESTCHTLQKDWKPMVERFGEEALSCAYSSYPKSHPGWEQWKPKHSVHDDLHYVYVLWASRWWVSWQFLKEGANVLSLDVDAVLLTDIYQLLRAPPLSEQDVILTQNADASKSLNCGFVYFNRDAAGKAPPTNRELGTKARQELKSCAAAHDPNSEAAEADGVPAAEWVARAVWDRIALFLELRRSSLSNSPVREVLWEQDAWNDLAKSLELNRRVFPWAVGYGKDSDLWPLLGYKRTVIGGMLHQEKWVKWKSLKLDKSLPPWKPPKEEHARRFWRGTLRQPLPWLALCPPVNQSSGADVQVSPGTTFKGVPLGVVADDSRPLRRGRMMIAPIWLASLGSDPEPAWAAASPPAFSYLHLTNMWHCFPHMCWSKAGRLFWLRAHGFWDERLDDMQITPRGAPFSPQTRALALPLSFFAAVDALTPPHSGDPAMGVTARMRWLAFRRMHALIHNLVTLAALVDRKPVIPTVPCGFVRATQQRAQDLSASSRFGVSHPSVVATGTKEKPVCHLAPGTWRPGGPDQCYQNRILSQFDYDRFARQPYAINATRHPLPTVRVPTAPLEPPTTVASYEKVQLDIEQYRTFCKNVAAHPNTMVLELEGLIPIQDLVLDAPVGVSEFESEALRLKSGRPRWRSLLQAPQLAQLLDVCPGAQKFLDSRKACVGYYLAE